MDNELLPIFARNGHYVVYSLRGLLEWFLEFVEECEGDALRELQEMFASWAEVKKEARLTLKGYLRQLFAIVQHLPSRDRLIIVYNQNNSPFWVLRV